MTDVYERINVELSEKEAIISPQIRDNLTKIKGIGLGTAEKLNIRKIYTYRQLAELTPEKLSEAPGVGIATARKFIEEAKKLLEGIPKDDNIKLPDPSKKEPVIVQKTKEDVIVQEGLELETCEIAETVVEEDLELNEPIQQRNVTPYKQLLARSDDKIENAIIESEEIETETETGVDNIETFEVAEVIVEEELTQEELQREEKPVETNQKQWFSDKFNYSRLTASHPPILERSSRESTVEIEEIKIEEIEEEEIEEYQEEVPEFPEVLDVPERLENNAIVEPFESEASFPEESIPREEKVVIPISTELPEVTEILEVEIPKIVEVQKVLEVPEIPEVTLEILEVPTKSRTLNPREELTDEVVKSLKNLGYHAIPSGIEALSSFFQKVDYIGLKLVSVKNNSKLILLIPIKLCDLEGTILIHEGKIDFKTYSKAQESELVRTARHYADELLRTKNNIFEDVVNGNGFRSFVEKYLQIRFAAEKSAKNKKLYFVSGQTQYKVLIEPILLTKIPAKCMEKSILYPYQRKTNLHVIDRSNIGHLLRFLEKKYKLIESRAKKTSSIETYQNAEAKFRSSLRLASLPFLGYSVVLFVVYFSQFYFLLRLLNSIGIAAIGIYSFAIGYFYFKFYKTKKELTTEFETPYYLQNLQFSETDLLCVKEEFTDEQMAQFGYECFGKDNDFKVLEQIEKDNIKESVVAKLREKNAPQLFELDSELEDSSINKTKNEIKYSSFLED
jgi:hypothetical protein